MTLRRKTILVMLITLAGLILLLYAVLRAIMMDSFGSLETVGALRNLSRAANSLQEDTDSIGRIIHDWSSWDESYQFVRGDNPDFVADNLMDSTFWTVNINLMMFIDSNNRIVYTKAVDLDPAWQNRLQPSFEDYVNSDKRFLRLTTATPTTGFLVVDGEPMLIASRPILRSDDSGPSAGTLIWARHFGAQELAATSESLRLSLTLRGINTPDLPPDVRSALAAISPSSPQMVAAPSSTTVSGYALLDDIYSQPSLMLKTAQDRNIYQQGQTALTYFAVALLILGVVFAGGVLLLLERLTLLPLARLSDQVRRIGVNDDFSMRLPVSGHNELTQLATAINTMLNTVSQSREALKQLNTDLETRVIDRTGEVERQRSQLQAIMDTMGEGLVYCADGMISYVNGAFIELMNYPAADLVGKPFELLYARIDPEQTAVSAKMLQRYETRLIRRDGTIMSAAITSTPIDDDPQRRVIIVRDITQELANKTQRDYFFARASHDLRSPLTSMMTRLYLLGKKPEQLDSHLKVLNSISSQMLQLVNDLLDISRFEQGAMVVNRRDLVLQSVAEEVVEVQRADAEMRHIHLSADLVEMPLHVYGDPMRLNQVITNLVSNAIRYTPEGGEIVVRVAEDQRGDKQCAVVQVRDTGIGILPEHLAHIFDPFFRVSDESEIGSGLGLYIVKEIVELHAGQVTVESEIGKGTTFTVYLALSTGAQPQRPGQAQEKIVMSNE